MFKALGSIIFYVWFVPSILMSLVPSLIIIGVLGVVFLLLGQFIAALIMFALLINAGLFRATNGFGIH